MKHTEYEEVKLRLGNMSFTWDDEKEQANIRKHKIDFMVAASVFLDKDAIFELNSVDYDTGEERWDAIGIFDAGIIFVVYVERVTLDNNDIIRIISARYADRKEKKRYVLSY